MTWSEFMRARQQLTEEFVGVLYRDQQRVEKARVEATKAAIRKHEAATMVRTIEPRPITDEVIG